MASPETLSAESHGSTSDANFVFVTGALVDEVALRETHAGSPCATFLLRVVSARTPTVVRVNAYERTAAYARDLERGTRVGVRGELHTRRATDGAHLTELKAHSITRLT